VFGDVNHRITLTGYPIQIYSDAYEAAEVSSLLLSLWWGLRFYHLVRVRYQRMVIVRVFLI
jgi:hypothetical protein